MDKWIFEPGHTGAEFRVRHMMVTWVRGHFKDVHGFVEFDPADPKSCFVEAHIDLAKIWTGESARDAHLKSSDFFDVETFPELTFKGSDVMPLGENDFQLTGDMRLHDTTKQVTLDVHYLGQWETPYWEEDGDKGPVTRLGFTAQTTINRADFGISWNDNMANGGFVLGNDVIIRIDAEAIRESDLIRIEEARLKSA